MNTQYLFSRNFSKKKFSKFTGLFLVIVMLVSAIGPGIFAVKDVFAVAKVDICHKEGNSWKFMETPAGSSLDGHLGHGDFLYKGDSGLTKNQKDVWCQENTPKTPTPPQENPTGTIRVCKIILDHEGNVVTGTAGTTFTVPFVNANYEGPATQVLASAVFNTPISLDQNLFGDSSKEGQCVTYDHLSPGIYYYGQEVISPDPSLWETPKYHDGYTALNGLSDFGLFNTDLDPQYDNFDGVITLGSGATRTLVVLNQMKEGDSPLENVCVVPSALKDDHTVSFGVSPEKTLQQILDENSYTINTVNDETNVQVWNVPALTASVTFTASKIASLAGNTNTLGYYVNGDINTFVSVTYDTPTVVNTAGVTSIGFALRSVSGSGTSDFATEKSLNPGGDDHAVVYNPTSNNYVIAFEDISPLGSSDKDYNDLVVKVVINSCEGLEPCQETSGSIVSGANTKVVDIDGNPQNSPAVDVTHTSITNTYWTADDGGDFDTAKWVWSEDPVKGWTVDKVVTFEEKFTIVGDPQSAHIFVAADNDYEVFVNGNSLGTNATLNQGHVAPPGSFAINPSLLTNGVNTLKIVVTNKGQDGSALNNPGGLIYNLTWTAEDCGDNPPQEPEEKEYSVTFHKYINGVLATEESSKGVDFEIEWGNGEQNGNTFLLKDSNFSHTLIVDESSSLTWNETDSNGNVVLGNECVEGKFKLSGYTYGSTLVDAEDMGLSNESSLNGIVGNKHVIVWNEYCPVIPPPCVEGPTWADEVVPGDDFTKQGTRKNGSEVNVSRTDPNSVLGTPDGNGNAGTGFFSLGVNGKITVKFDHYIENVAGVDLSFHEITNGRDSYPEEKADVEVSQDGITWKYIGTVSSKAVGGVDYLDFDSTGWSWIQYVRITDITNFGLHASDADGYDLDAIDAVNGLCDKPITLSAVKIECEVESLLPNWGAGNIIGLITSATANDWINDTNYPERQKQCKLVPWDFQWAPADTGNPGDSVEYAGNPWTTFTGNISIALSQLNGNHVWVREALKPNYIGFGGENTTQNVSAEFYCHDDLLNYDNYEWIGKASPLVAGSTYHCVGWNVPVDNGGGGQNGPFTLTLILWGDGEGDVLGEEDEEESDPFVCSKEDVSEQECQYQFTANTNLNLVPSPFEGSNFDSSWSESCSGNALCSITMDSDKIVKAHFAKDGTLIIDSVTSTGGGGGGSSSSRRQNPPLVLGASTENPGEVLGATVGLPNTGRADEGSSASSSVYWLMALSILSLAGLNLSKKRV